MKKFFMAVGIIGALASCGGQATRTPSPEDNNVMKEQADAFLRGMPTDLQHRQALAVRKAVNGDRGDLNAVREARNSAPATPAGVTTRMLTPTLRLYEPKDRGNKKLPLLIYLHGGGWTFGSLNSCARFCNAMAESGRLKVLAVDYRLAPEHPFPAGLEDCVKAVGFAWADADKLGVDRGKISVGGDSSGGNLAIATSLSDSCAGKIESLVLFYPVTKAYDDGSSSWNRYDSGFGLDTELMCEFNHAYVAGADPLDKRISVGDCGDDILGRLPRALLIAAGRDILCDQGEEFARKAGKRLTRIEFPGAVHLFITVPGQDKAFSTAVELASDFLL